MSVFEKYTELSLPQSNLEWEECRHLAMTLPLLPRDLVLLTPIASFPDMVLTPAVSKTTASFIRHSCVCHSWKLFWVLGYGEFEVKSRINREAASGFFSCILNVSFNTFVKKKKRKKKLPKHKAKIFCWEVNSVKRL